MAKEQRLRLKKFVPISGVQIIDTAYKTVALGSSVDLGSAGPHYVADLWFEDGVVWFELEPRTPNLPVRLQFISAPGAGEPLLGAELEKHLKALEAKRLGKAT